MFAVVAGLFLLRLKLPRFRLPIVGRLALVALSLFSLYSFGLRSPWAGSMIYRAGVNEIPWNQQENYGNNGTALAFTMNVKNSIVPKPDNYGESTIAGLASQITGTKAEAKAAAAPADPFGGKKPNVIFIMNEAFWDPTLLPGVTYSEDPVPTIHQLQKESTSGYLLSPQFGGGTSNVEFEVLTGNSMSFLPAGSVPYEQYVNKPTPSLASYFDSQGYKSMGIHSYDGWFWNRNNVYKQLGFETFKSKEHFDNPEYAGPFISDAEVSRNIIKEVDSTDRSMFIYAVTMQNHGGYDGDRYPGGNPIKAQGSLTPDAKQILENYTHGARDADQSLKMLIDHFQQSDEPTVIVFYGDHLPMLGMDYDVYKQGGFIPTSNTEQWTDEENRKMHSVPFVVWSNVNLPTKQYPALSDAFLGANMLDLMGMEAPAPFRYNLEFSKQFPGLLRNLVIDGQGNLHKNVPETLQAQVDQYRDLQYDNLFGKRYLAKFLDQDYLNKDSLPNYNAEFGGASPPASPKGKGAS
ncbi:LTA synthase family protein [Paenibacillus sp. CC-CFT747]|nr:LTA synthase family protein [Paenibacillus sp. CC-CFT747]